MKISIHPKLFVPMFAGVFILTIINLTASRIVRAQDILSNEDVRNIVFTYQTGSKKSGRSIPAKTTVKTGSKNNKNNQRGLVQKNSGKINDVKVAPSNIEPTGLESEEPVLAGGILNGLTTYFEMPGFSQEELKKYRGDEIKVQVTVNAEGEVTQAQAKSGPGVLRERAVEKARRATFYRSRFMNNPISLTGELVYVVTDGDDSKKYDNSPNKTPLVVAGGALNGKEISSLINGAAAADNGEVKVQVTVDEEGKVTSARAVSGNPALYKAAVDSAGWWTFPRTSVLGNQVKVGGYIVINFKSSI
jgi:hypothetical protein